MLFKLKILYYYLINRFFRRFRNRSDLVRFQQKKIGAHLKWVKQHSPFYRNWQGGLIDKKIMMENFSELNTVGINRDEAFQLAFAAEESRDFTATLKEVTIGLSSGTSGNRGLFLVSDHERARHAGTMLAKILPNSLFSKNRVAFFMRANSNLYTASKSSRLEFEFFDLLTPLEEHLVRLESFRPTLLFAPPSMLLQIAKSITAYELRISPYRVFSIMETLDPLDQKHIEAAFGQVVHQIYQCTEGFLAATCKEGVLHLNEDCVRIEPEWLDDTKRKFMPIITDFTRTSQPIIRYRLNDILTIRTQPCPCGSVMMALESIEGRTDDIIQFLNSQGDQIPVFPDFIRRAIMSATDEIEEYQVKQMVPGELKIHLAIKDSGKNTDIESRIKNELRNLSKLMKAEMPHLTFFDQIPNLDGKKLRRVMRE